MHLSAFWQRGGSLRSKRLTVRRFVLQSGRRPGTTITIRLCSFCSTAPSSGWWNVSRKLLRRSWKSPLRGWMSWPAYGCGNGYGEPEAGEPDGWRPEIKAAPGSGKWSAYGAEEKAGEWGEAVSTGLFDLHIARVSEPYGDSLSAVRWRRSGSIEPMTCKRKRGILISSQIRRGRRRCRFGSKSFWSGIFHAIKILRISYSTKKIIALRQWGRILLKKSAAGGKSRFARFIWR